MGSNLDIELTLEAAIATAQELLGDCYQAGTYVSEEWCANHNYEWHTAQTHKCEYFHEVVDNYVLAITKYRVLKEGQL